MRRLLTVGQGDPNTTHVITAVGPYLYRFYLDNLTLVVEAFEPVRGGPLEVLAPVALVRELWKAGQGDPAAQHRVLLNLWFTYRFPLLFLVSILSLRLILSYNFLFLFLL